jgi:hypothetical protein
MLAKKSKFANFPFLLITYSGGKRTESWGKVRKERGKWRKEKTRRRRIDGQGGR